MKRDLEQLARERFDLVVVGGGIFGVCTAWEAVTRGLKVALVEASDFGHATSANCFKVIHGGVRYMQHGDIARVRSSVKERSILLKIAPHLARPLPIVIPTYGRGKQGKAFLHAGMTAYNLVTADRNRSIYDPARKIPGHSLLGRDEILNDYPWLGRDTDRAQLTGGVLFYDGQMVSPERLVLSFLRSAAEAGACVANYVKAERFIRQGDRVAGVTVKDELTGECFDIQAETTVNAAGPWAETLLSDGSDGLALRHASTFSRDAWFLLRRPWVSTNALALQAQSRDPDALLSRDARHLFVVPWRGHTIVGVWHVVTEMSADKVDVPDSDLQGFIDEVNWACPELDITIDEVGAWNAGLVLFGDDQKSENNLSYGKRSRIVDHSVESGVDGLITLIGVRYTTARGEACRVLDMIENKLDLKLEKSQSDTLRLHGGDTDDIRSLEQQVRSDLLKHTDESVLDERTVAAVSAFHGSDYKAVLGLLEHDDPGQHSGQILIGNTHVLRAEIVNACRNEMATRLDDMVLRRTELADGSHPGAAVLAEVADIMAAECGWSAERRSSEIDIADRSLAHRRYRELD